MLHIEEDYYLYRYGFSIVPEEPTPKTRKKTASRKKKAAKKAKKKKPDAPKEKRWVTIKREHPIAAQGWEEEEGRDPFFR
jgi:hypothetical protein